MKYFLSGLFSLLILAAQAQKSNEVSGIVIGSVLESQNGKAIPGATVSIANKNDTTLRKLQLTDKNGSFEIDRLPFGYYSLSVTSIGFSNLRIDSIYLRAERYDFNLGDVKLQRSSAQLLEVIVYAEKPLIENADGKITYNVGESALSSGSTAAELLKTMPLVNNDPNGKILLKGKEPKILIDDKPTDLTAQQLQDLLESLPGNSIERIELMTNPPPQYASEAGGVINIVTKKGKVGLFGKVTVSGGSRGEGTLTGNISYRNKNLTISGSAGSSASSFKGNNYSRRQNFYTDSANYFNTDSRFLNKNVRPNFRVQTDYELNKQNSFSATVQGNLNYFDNNSLAQYTNLNSNNEIYKLSTRENASQGNGYNHALTLAYNFRSKNSSERLQIIANGNIGKNDNGRDFFQAFLHPDFTPTGIDSTQIQGIDNYNNSFSLRVNYDKPLKWKAINLSTGASYFRSNNHNILNTEFYRKPDAEFVLNDLLSTNFLFHQDIYTLRAAFNYRFLKDWRITAGAQAEGTATNFEFLKGNANDVNNNYWNVLPTFTLRKDFSKAINTSIVYRATIRRPGIGELNPAIDYSDPYNTRFGNPYLRPSTADNLDWNLGIVKGKFYVNASVGYNKVKDVFNTIRTLVESGRTEITYMNIANRKEYESSIWGGYTFSKKLRVNVSTGYSLNKYGEEEIKLYKYRNGSTFYSSLNYSFTPNNLTTFDGNARYSSFADPQGRARSNLTMNLGVQRKFFNKRVIVSLTAIDPIKAQKFVTYTYGAKFTSENYNSTQTRNFRVAVSYQLNKVVQKSKLSSKAREEALKKIQAKK